METINKKQVTEWTTTSNLTIENNFFYNYMKEHETLFKWMKTKESVGHGLERLVMIHCLLNNKNIINLDKLISHYQLDSHKTQGHDVIEGETMLGILSKTKL